MVEWSTSTPRSSMSSSTWRVLSGYATYQRTPMRMTSLGKWAPLKLIAIVSLPHESSLVVGGDHTANENLRQNQPRRGKEPKPVEDSPPDKAQCNFTDA